MVNDLRAFCFGKKLKKFNNVFLQEKRKIKNYVETRKRWTNKMTINENRDLEIYFIREGLSKTTKKFMDNNDNHDKRSEIFYSAVVGTIILSFFFKWILRA